MKSSFWLYPQLLLIYFQFEVGELRSVDFNKVQVADVSPLYSVLDGIETLLKRFGSKYNS